MLQSGQRPIVHAVSRRLQEQHAARSTGGDGVRGVEQGVLGGGANCGAAAGDGGVVEEGSEEYSRESGAGF